MACRLPPPSRSTHTSSCPAVPAPTGRQSRSSPGEPAIAFSIPSWSASVVAYLKGVLPLRRHVRQALVDHLRRRQRRIEVLEAANAHPVHPLQVQLDAFLGDVAVHPVPPYARPRALGRVEKTLAQRVGRGGRSCARAADASNRTKQARFMPGIVHRNMSRTARMPCNAPVSARTETIADSGEHGILAARRRARWSPQHQWPPDQIQPIAPRWCTAATKNNRPGRAFPEPAMLASGSFQLCWVAESGSPESSSNQLSACTSRRRGQE